MRIVGSGRMGHAESSAQSLQHILRQDEIARGPSSDVICLVSLSVGYKSP